MSTPTFTDFDPHKIPWQFNATKAAHKFDYTKGVYEQFYSGSIGSAKTIQHIHLIVKHCLENKGARYLMTRRVLKDLKRTSWAVLLRHMADIPQYIESYNKSDMKITFINGSEILGDSYEKGDLEKFRSLELTGADFEEGNECNQETYEAIKMRVGRVPGVKQNIITIRCNPDEPSHWLYKYFIQDIEHQCKQVFYSLTEQNPFLPKWYIENLRRDLTPLMAKRMLMGQWISIKSAAIYYAYDDKTQFIKKPYQVNPYFPIDLMHDFNIGQGKPMSMALGQYINGSFHIFNEFIMDGFNTGQLMDEVIDSGIFEKRNKFRVFGDCNGWNKDTRGTQTDYDIIQSKIEKYKRKNGTHPKVAMEVPKSNPLVRARQNIVNVSCCNDLNEKHFFVYKDAPTVDEGLRLTKLKKGSTYQEDDSDRFQHVITAVGYYIYRIKNYIDNEVETDGIIFE